MYLGAQSVRDTEGHLSVTSYLYLHLGSLSDAQQHRLQDVRGIAQFAPGQLAHERHEGRAGGRTVSSYLDISGPDDLEISELEDILDQLQTNLANSANWPMTHGRCGAEFVSQGVNQAQEFALLRREIIRLFSETGARPPKRELVILVRRNADSTMFFWNEKSRDLLASHEPDWVPSRLNVSDEVREAFEQLHGAFFPNAVDMLRPGSSGLVEKLGGVQAEDEVSGKVLWFSASESTS